MVPDISDLIVIMGTPLSATDWLNNWTTVCNWFTDGTADVTFKSVKQGICTVATIPISPFIGQEIFVTDVDWSIAKRIYTSDGWKIIPLASL